MYKVFFKDRIVFFSDDFEYSFHNNYDLFFKYHDKERLNELIKAFISFSHIRTLCIYHDDLDVLRKDFLSCFKFIRASGGLVYNAKDEILVIKRNGIWDLPKGKLEPNENPGNAAIREVSEECGLKSLILENSFEKTYHTYHIGDTPVLKETEWFRMRTKGSEKTRPQLKEDITATRWLKKSEIQIILQNTYASIIDVLRKAGLMG